MEQLTPPSSRTRGASSFFLLLRRKEIVGRFLLERKETGGPSQIFFCVERGLGDPFTVSSLRAASNPLFQRSAARGHTGIFLLRPATGAAARLDPLVPHRRPLSPHCRQGHHLKTRKSRRTGRISQSRRYCTGSDSIASGVTA